jgi:hypothetical protein
MKWEDLTTVEGDDDDNDDDESVEWRIAREAREKGAAERLRLPKLVRDIIDAQPLIANNPYVFAATVGGGPVQFVQPAQGGIGREDAERHQAVGGA